MRKMNFETELVSQTVQNGERYLDFDIEAEERYPVRVRSTEDRLEVFVGESFEKWLDDYISRKRLSPGWQNSFYVDENIEIDELREEYEDVFDRYSNQINNAISPETNPGSLEHVKAALD
jgi:hypothetical protein